jgi:hypothetical protein
MAASTAAALPLAAGQLVYIVNQKNRNEEKRVGRVQRIFALGDHAGTIAIHVYRFNKAQYQLGNYYILFESHTTMGDSDTLTFTQNSAGEWTTSIDMGGYCPDETEGTSIHGYETVAIFMLEPFVLPF